jgi:hypothetical protein
MNEVELQLLDACLLIEEMTGLDKGPHEEEYIEWESRAQRFIDKHRDLFGRKTARMPNYSCDAE